MAGSPRFKIYSAAGEYVGRDQRARAGGGVRGLPRHRRRNSGGARETPVLLA